MRGTRIAGWGLALLVPANAVVVVSLWWSSGGAQDVDDTGSLLVGIARICGLLGAYLVLVELVLLARLPALERLAGFERLTRLHRLNGFTAISLLLVHAVLVVVGYALTDRLSLLDELGKLISGYPGVITAIAGLAALVAVVVTSIVIVRRRLRYETWYFVHLYAYLGVALAFSHQLATGTDFVGEPAARAYWIALYVVTLAIIVVFRIGQPLARSLFHRLHVARVVEEGPGVVSIEIGGVRLERLRARAGQFFTWRFLTPRPLVGGPSVLALRRPRRPPPAHHGQGRRRLHRAPARDPARHARDRGGAVRRLHQRGAAAPARGADRGRRRDHADPRAARGHARRARATSPSSTAR